MATRTRIRGLKTDTNIGPLIRTHHVINVTITPEATIPYHHPQYIYTLLIIYHKTPYIYIFSFNFLYIFSLQLCTKVLKIQSTSTYLKTGKLLNIPFNYFTPCIHLKWLLTNFHFFLFTI